MTFRAFLFMICLFSLTPPIHAQWGRTQTGVTLSRGQIGHTVFYTGQSGRRDHGGKQDWASFSYPMGRNPLVYSGGVMRTGWNARSNSGGEGIWVMSKKDGQKQVSVAGSETLSQDVVGLPGDPSQWPEAYVGATHHENYALANYQKSSNAGRNGTPAPWTMGVDLLRAKTNWWPQKEGIASPRTPIQREPVSIWNFRYGRYNSNHSFEDQIANGALAPANAPAWAASLSEDDFPEQIVVNRAKSTETGLQWTRKWFSWGHSDYDDFLISETVVENTSNTVAEGVYIVLQNRFASQAANDYRVAGTHYKPRDWASDDFARSTMAADYLNGVSHAAFLSGEGKPAGLSVGKELAERGHAMLYAHDGESTHISNVNLDVGDPYRYQWAIDRLTRDQTWIREGFLNHGQYFGVGVVDALPPFHTYGGMDSEIYVAPHDNLDTQHNESLAQPASITMWRFVNHNEFEHPSILKDSPEQVYDVLTQAGFHNEPTAPFSYSHFMTFGPYDLQSGEKAKVVVAYVGATGANAPKYDDYKRYAEPFTLSWLNLYGGRGLPDVSFSDRQPEIPLGEEALFRHFNWAIDAYTWGYDLPNEPPSIKLAYENTLEGQTKLRWSAFGERSRDPDYEGAEAEDLRGYRLYRSTTVKEGPWELVGEFSFEDAQLGLLSSQFEYHPNKVFHTVPDAVFPTGIPLRANPLLSGLDPNAGDPVQGMYTFVDRDVPQGFHAWYSVRYIDSGHDDWNGTGQAIAPLESSPGPAGSAMLSHLGGGLGIIPKVPGSQIYDRLEKRVQVVPNPWRANDTLHSYGRSEFIRFINLPGRCQIDLYDTSGQRFWTFFNNDPLKGEAFWNHLTEGRPTQFGNAVNSGIYFWKVTSLMPESMGKSQKGTFIIIK